MPFLVHLRLSAPADEVVEVSIDSTKSAILDSSSDLLEASEPVKKTRLTNKEIEELVHSFPAFVRALGRDGLDMNTLIAFTRSIENY